MASQKAKKKKRMGAGAGRERSNSWKEIGDQVTGNNEIHGLLQRRHGISDKVHQFQRTDIMFKAA
jgi:hypothetical protein